MRLFKRYKEYLVAKVINQTKSIDLLEAFSPTVKMTTIRFLISLNVSNNRYLHQLNINTAFLHWDDEEI